MMVSADWELGTQSMTAGGGLPENIQNWAFCMIIYVTVESLKK